MRLLGTAMLIAIATAGSALSHVRAAAPVPSGGGAVAANVPRLLLVGLVLAAAATGRRCQPGSAQAQCRGAENGPAAPFFRAVLSERAVWVAGPRSRHVELQDTLAYYIA